jgi:hypothetical protein
LPLKISSLLATCGSIRGRENPVKIGELKNSGAAQHLLA